MSKQEKAQQGVLMSNLSPTVLNVTGMNRHTGQQLAEDRHILQSLTDILTTPVGSRVMRRDYGSILPLLVDQPASPRLFMQVRAAVIHAIMRWEQRVKPVAIHIIPSITGQASIQLDYELVTHNNKRCDTIRLEDLL